MVLQFHFHPLASFCHKALIALYENDTPFEPVIVDFGDPQSAAAFKELWPMAKMPVLVDEDRGAKVAESTIVIEYLEQFHPGSAPLLPGDPDASWQARFWDRFFDFYVHQPMQQIVVDNLRPEGRRDPLGVEQAYAQLGESYAYLETQLLGREWMSGDAFSIADCSASPALFYANTVKPFEPDQTSLRAYHARLMARPSYARVLREAEPYFHFFPMTRKPRIG